MVPLNCHYEFCCYIQCRFKEGFGTNISETHVANADNDRSWRVWYAFSALHWKPRPCIPHVIREEFDQTVPVQIHKLKRFFAEVLCCKACYFANVNNSKLPWRNHPAFSAPHGKLMHSMKSQSRLPRWRVWSEPFADHVCHKAGSHVTYMYVNNERLQWRIWSFLSGANGKPKACVSLMQSAKTVSIQLKKKKKKKTQVSQKADAASSHK